MVGQLVEARAVAISWTASLPWITRECYVLLARTSAVGGITSWLLGDGLTALSVYGNLLDHDHRALERSVPQCSPAKTFIQYVFGIEGLQVMGQPQIGQMEGTANARKWRDRTTQRQAHAQAHPHVEDSYRA